MLFYEKSQLSENGRFVNPNEMAQIQRGVGGRGPVPLPGNSQKNIGFLSNSGPYPLKNQHSKLGHHQDASKTPFRWRFAGGSGMTRL